MKRKIQVVILTAAMAAVAAGVEAAYAWLCFGTAEQTCVRIAVWNLIGVSLFAVAVAAGKDWLARNAGRMAVVCLGACLVVLVAGGASAWGFHACRLLLMTGIPIGAFHLAVSRKTHDGGILFRQLLPLAILAAVAACLWKVNGPWALVPSNGIIVMSWFASGLFAAMRGDKCRLHIVGVWVASILVSLSAAAAVTMLRPWLG